MRFNVKTDIDLDRLKQRAFAEAEHIYNRESTRRDRTLQEVRRNCLMGHAAELYLIDHCGFKDDPRPFKDVFDTEDLPVEVKVTKKAKDVYHILRRANEYALEKWREYPKRLYIFLVNEYNGDYELNGIYNWNGKEFV
jgi:hypothetical protein